METKINSNDELEKFKLEINLVEYAASQGFQLFKKHSSRNSKAMKHPETGEKIIIATSAVSGHGIYFNVHDENRDPGGTIIDFVQRRQRLNLGQVRKVLRTWLGGDRAPLPDIDYEKPLPSEADIQGVIESYGRATSTIPRYLTDQRGIDRETIKDPRFSSVIRVDDHRNALFPHFDAACGLCGYEIKGQGYTGFAKGGRKGVWRTPNLLVAPTIVICESAIDALAYDQLHDAPDAAYVSLGGSLNDAQPDLLKQMIRQAAERRAEVLIAVDRDDAGHKYTAQIVAWSRDVGIKARDDRPVGGHKDWDEVLLERQRQENRLAAVPGIRF